MPVLTPAGAEILIACVTIGWGILVETWYVSRWTIFFNIVPMVALLATFEGDAGFLWFMGVFLLISFVLVGATGYQWLKHLIGAKGYGVFALSAGLIASGMFTPEWFFWLVLFIGFFTGLFWLVVYLVKSQYG